MALARRPWIRRTLIAAAVLAAAYAAALAGLFVLMHQRPAVVGKGMSYVPGPAFALLPMESMWCRAREGALRVGEAAPDFTLETLDGTRRVRLSERRGERPVVLVFGSYT
jgi:hypothetical protein